MRSRPERQHASLESEIAGGRDKPVTTADEVSDVLRLVDDPELGMNIVDLGLVYGVEVADGGEVSVTMTMTTPACPLGDYLKRAIEAAVRQRFPEVRAVAVDIVWEPRWEPAMMSDLAKVSLGWLA